MLEYTEAVHIYVRMCISSEYRLHETHILLRLEKSFNSSLNSSKNSVVVTSIANIIS